MLWILGFLSSIGTLVGDCSPEAEKRQLCLYINGTHRFLVPNFRELNQHCNFTIAQFPGAFAFYRTNNYSDSIRLKDCDTAFLVLTRKQGASNPAWRRMFCYPGTCDFGELY
jgi:hypothetical protein